jgi:dTDP-4-amino-4,6-dideoxygalactose transaminase
VDGILTPEYPDGAEPIYMSFVVHHPRRDAFMAGLRKRGVDTTFGYMSDCSDHPLFAEFRRPQPNSAVIIRDQVHLPVHPRMDARDTGHIAESVRQVVWELGA